MLGEPSAPAAYWEQVGRLAIEQGVERIIMMGAHWHPEGDAFYVATNPQPSKQPVAWVDPKKYKDFDPNIDVKFSEHVLRELRSRDFNVMPAPNFEIIHDTFLIRKCFRDGNGSCLHSRPQSNGCFRRANRFR